MVSSLFCWRRLHSSQDQLNSVLAPSEVSASPPCTCRMCKKVLLRSELASMRHLVALSAACALNSLARVFCRENMCFLGVNLSLEQQLPIPQVTMLIAYLASPRHVAHMTPPACIVCQPLEPQAPMHSPPSFPPGPPTPSCLKL